MGDVAARHVVLAGLGVTAVPDQDSERVRNKKESSSFGIHHRRLLFFNELTLFPYGISLYFENSIAKY